MLLKNSGDKAGIVSGMNSPLSSGRLFIIASPKEVNVEGLLVE
jgi:hypothetical protein